MANTFVLLAVDKFLAKSSPTIHLFSILFFNFFYVLSLFCHQLDSLARLIVSVCCMSSLAEWATMNTHLNELSSERS